MTSSIARPRRCFALCSPITQRMASTTFDLPQPLGPTTPGDAVVEGEHRPVHERLEAGDVEAPDFHRPAGHHDRPRFSSLIRARQLCSPRRERTGEMRAPRVAEAERLARPLAGVLHADARSTDDARAAAAGEHNQVACGVAEVGAILRELHPEGLAQVSRSPRVPVQPGQRVGHRLSGADQDRVRLAPGPQTQFSIGWMP